MTEMRPGRRRCSSVFLDIQVFECSHSTKPQAGSNIFVSIFFLAFIFELIVYLTLKHFYS